MIPFNVTSVLIVKIASPPMVIAHSASLDFSHRDKIAKSVQHTCILLETSNVKTVMLAVLNARLRLELAQYADMPLFWLTAHVSPVQMDNTTNLKTRPVSHVHIYVWPVISLEIVTV